MSPGTGSQPGQGLGSVFLGLQCRVMGNHESWGLVPISRGGWDSCSRLSQEQVSASVHGMCSLAASRPQGDQGNGGPVTLAEDLELCSACPVPGSPDHSPPPPCGL